PMTAVLRPAADWELAGIIADAAARAVPLHIAGNGTKAAIGRPVSGQTVSLRGLNGVTLYEPAELVMSVKAGTLVADVEAQLARSGQMLPFEPIDIAAVLGGERGLATMGGVFATNFGGARRVLSGAPRDHLLGV